MKTWVNGLVKATRTAGTYMASNKRITAGVGLYAASKVAQIPGFVKQRSDSMIDVLEPGRMLPVGRGKFGTRNEMLSQSPTQGVRFNFRRR